MSIEIVAATRKDIPTLVKMFFNPDLKTSPDESEWFVNCYFDYHHILVAKVDEEVRGACMWRIEGERYSGLGWIENLWVEDLSREQGLGEKILRAAVEDIGAYFRSIGIRPRKIVLTTQVERHNARSLYEKVGFRKVADIDEMYDPGGKDIIYMMDSQ